MKVTQTVRHNTEIMTYALGPLGAAKTLVEAIERLSVNPDLDNIRFSTIEGLNGNFAGWRLFWTTQEEL